MKPVLPAGTVVRPICCRVLARARGRPQANVALREGMRKAAPCFFLRSSSTGSSARQPSSVRRLWKVKGPIKFMPNRCATNAVPQISAVKSSSRLPLAFFMGPIIAQCIILRNLQKYWCCFFSIFW